MKDDQSDHGDDDNSSEEINQSQEDNSDSSVERKMNEELENPNIADSNIEDQSLAHDLDKAMEEDNLSVKKKSKGPKVIWHRVWCKKCGADKIL